ncbi:iron-sulfur cluster repair di-iron protein, ric [Tissierella creatinophila]|uniref:Iron-sulfur cluster repair protein ScdA n=1 Tax=Tissierella creatinophila DSM 6911 TaxID=1123403 RepID=A0A1U7M6R6_TISCR|nr:iron-sulfur cluster repair di-iron protein, ric [Tissierella creatinophila]OLS02981.1 iron-sulfur cluster repair protein ScdA [Tissierella creatinophila DSM 6911]
MTKFNKVIEKNIERLEQFVPIVDRVHGGSHPEFKDVHKLFDKINAKIKETESEKPEIDNEFKELRKVTNNYTVPGDVCESYEAVYNMLSELDEAYNI